MNQREVDTIFINNFEKLQIDISNEELVNQTGKRRFVATISFAKDRKLVKQHEDVYSEDIMSILSEELSKIGNESDRVVIEFRNLYYLLGLYVYPIR